MTSYRGHGHDVVEVPVHGHSIEYMEAGRLHRDHKRSKYYSYLPNAPYAYDVPAVTVVRGSRPHYVQPAMVVDGSSPVTVIKGNGHGHDNVNVHEVSLIGMRLWVLAWLIITLLHLARSLPSEISAWRFEDGLTQEIFYQARKA